MTVVPFWIVTTRFEDDGTVRDTNSKHGSCATVTEARDVIKNALYDMFDSYWDEHECGGCVCGRRCVGCVCDAMTEDQSVKFLIGRFWKSDDHILDMGYFDTDLSSWIVAGPEIDTLVINLEVALVKERWAQQWASLE